MNSFLDGAWRDLTYALRTLSLTPGFTAVALLSLALGVGANTAIFQLLDAVRLRTLPVDDPSQLVDVRINDGDRGRTGRFTGRNPFHTYPLFEQIRNRQQAFSGLAAFGSTTFNLATSGEAHYARGLWVNGDFFNALGLHPMVGRLLTPADDVPGCAAPSAVVSYGFWQRELGGDPSAIGRTIVLERHGYQVVGVTPPQFFGLEVGRSFDVAVPLCSEPLARVPSGLDQRDTWFLAVFGRLKPGWTREQASAHLSAISSNIFQSTLPPKYRPEDSKNYLAFTLTARPAATGVSSLRRDYETP